MTWFRRCSAVLWALVFQCASPTQGPGLGNLTYPSSQLNQPVSVIRSPEGHGNCAMVGGYLMLIYSQDGGGTSNNGGIDLWDVSDPRNPVLFRRYDDVNTNGLREAHGFSFSRAGGRTYLAAQAVVGVQIWDVTDPAGLFLVSELDLPGISSGDYEGAWWVFWQAPWLYVAGVSQGLFIVDASDPANPTLVRRMTASELAGIGPSQVFVVGNLAVLAKSQSDHLVTLDVSDPTDPVVLDTHFGATGYSHLFAGGKILTSGGDGGPVQMFAHDVDHDGRITAVGNSNHPGFSNGGYGSYQDGYFLSGMSNMVAKCDLGTFQVVGTGTSGLANRDEDFGQVLGNLVWAGDDHAVGSALIAHRTEPDSLGPDVHWVHPADGAVGVPVTGRVGISMSDNVDLDSVDGSSFVVREVGGAPVAGSFSVQMGLVNFGPDLPLAIDTTYEVVIDGIEDLVGNTGAVFRSTFTTGATTPQPPTTGFLAFDVDQPSRVTVLFDDRASVRPAWLSGWTEEGQSVQTTAGGYDVVWRDVPAGRVVLGGNADAPMAGAGSNYMVVVDTAVQNLLALSGQAYRSAAMEPGQDLYIDRTYTYVSMPAALQGQACIQTANDDKFAVSGVLPFPPTAGPTCEPLMLSPAALGSPVVLQAGAVSGVPPLSYAWSFGDGTTSAASASPTVSHIYQAAGRYPVVLTVTDANGSRSCAGVQVVHHPVTALPPAASRTVAVGGDRVFMVNTDQGSVSAVDATSLDVVWEVPAGIEPRSLAIAPDGDVWVVSQGDDSVRVLRALDGALLATYELARGAHPFGIAFRPDGAAALVTTQGRAGLLEIDTATGVVTRSLALEGAARGLAISHDSRRAWVTRFRSASAQPDHDRAGGAGRNGILPSVRPRRLPVGVVWEVDLVTMEVVARHRLRFDPGPDRENGGRGVPNYLSSLAISPDGRLAVVPSKKDNLARGLFRSGEPLTFESRTRAIVSFLDLNGAGEVVEARLDLNDRDMPQAVAFSPLGDLFVVATQGTNTVEVFDAATRRRVSSLATGRAPRGVVFDPTGARLFVQNFMDRSVTVYDTTELIAGGNGATRLADVSVVASELLAPTVLRGKQVFYDASDRRMNRDGYISCASCHLDGGHDGQVWDFSQAGEGLRNTISLHGRAGMAHGNLHWTANFDEVQDFENEIRRAFGGAGFLTATQFGLTEDPLGVPKSGASADLDALADYVSSLAAFPRSPHRSADGTMTVEAQQGALVFEQRGCVACHVPPLYTDGLRHDVGTIRARSGLGIGAPLVGVGIETPTLRGVWETAPYLHDGSAPGLRDVLFEPAHVGALTSSERSWLVAFLRELE